MFAIDIVPVDVIGPPVNPVPVDTEVTPTPAKAKGDHDPFNRPSNKEVSELNRIAPSPTDPRCAVVPIGKVIAAVPGVTGLSAIAKVIAVVPVDVI